MSLQSRFFFRGEEKATDSKNIQALPVIFRSSSPVEDHDGEVGKRYFTITIDIGRWV